MNNKKTKIIKEKSDLEKIYELVGNFIMIIDEYKKLINSQINLVNSQKEFINELIKELRFKNNPKI